VALVSLLLLLLLVLLGGAAARHALRHTAEPWLPTSSPVPALHPFIVMNFRSGGGKVVRSTRRTARALGAEVVLLFEHRSKSVAPAPTWLFGCALRGRVQLNWSSQWW